MPKLCASVVPESLTEAALGEEGKRRADSETPLSGLLLREAVDFRLALQRSVDATVHQYMARQDQVLAEYFIILGLDAAPLSALESTGSERSGGTYQAGGSGCDGGIPGAGLAEVPSDSAESGEEVQAPEDLDEKPVAEGAVVQAPWVTRSNSKIGKRKFLLHVEHGSKIHKKMYDKFGDWLEKWWEVEEPARTGRLAQVERTSIFHGIISIVILLNAFHSAAVCNYQVQGLQPPLLFVVAEVFFVVFYTFELCLKLYVHRIFFFIGDEYSWNILDIFLVVFGVFDFISEFLSGGSGSQIVFMRVLRVFRIGRALRTLRALRAFAELRVLLKCVMRSCASLFWSLCTILFIYYVFALAIVQMLPRYDLREAENATLIDENFGSVEMTMLTLFMLSLGGGDLTPLFAILEPDLNRVIIILFCLFFQITLVNILTGVQVDSALKHAVPHRVQLAKARHMREMEDEVELWEFFSSHFDPALPMAEAEFVVKLQKAKVRAFVETYEIEDDAPLIYKSVQSMNGEVTVQGLIEFILANKGAGTKIDFLRNKEMLQEIKERMEFLESIRPPGLTVL